jgi:SAM-dependent methyltransferase
MGAGQGKVASMDTALFHRLLGPEGGLALQAAARLQPREEDYLSSLAALTRAGIDRALAGAALETVLLRRRAAPKFSRAEEMFFLREALEQASGEAPARHRAHRFAGARRIADLGCGIGGDTVALAECAPVLAVDREELRLQMARANAGVCRPAHPVRWVRADINLLPFPGGLDADGLAVFCDPARREDARRIFSVRRYSPPLDMFTAWHARRPALPLCIKVSPGVRWEEIEREDCEVEFVSVQGELKEAVLWYGAFRTTRRRATMLPGRDTLTEDAPADDALSVPHGVLYEPDPSILRAGLVQQLAAMLGAARIDPQIAYLTADAHQPTPWARAFFIEEVMPFSLKKLRAWLREREVGEVVIKKRGSPIEPAELERQLRLRGEASRIVFLTQVDGKPYVLIAKGEIGGDRRGL